MSIERILGVDFGSKRVGLAVTDPLGITVFPLPYHKFVSRKDFLEMLNTLIQEKSIKKIVLGLPRSLDGTLGPKAVECQKLGEEIQKFCSVPVELEDESFTSRDADDILIGEMGASRQKRKELRDSLSAYLILKKYLDRP